MACPKVRGRKRLILTTSSGVAQDDKVKTAMELLRSMADKLGPPKTEGTAIVAGKEVPAIYFGSTKMNNNFDLVDEVVKQAVSYTHLTLPTIYSV